ncbi:MAG: NB-ARC domain-containing protein [Candidatus Electrothrix sp. GW3-4]|uniref:NB-ARC domain-containing protein n=1 Tax=Candidatus Electrothrix sp. GW3-4 TaxID=3126740 RepID=UPI0030D2A987
MAAENRQDVDGSDNIFSGSGPVTVNKVTKNYYSSEEPSSTTNAPSELATLFGVPNLPPRYLERNDYLDPFREALLCGKTQAVGITGRPQYVGMQGMGGLGKSVLAAALAWDEEVRRAFPDGIFWLRFGQEVDEAGVQELQKEILLVLAPDSKPESPAQGRNLLSLALQGKRCLLIADDLWDSRYINHFDLTDSGSRFLLTTRNNEVIQETGAHRCELELLSNGQARELLAKCSGFAEEDLPEEAEAILRECGRLPLAVAAIGSMVNGKGRSRWQLALEKLQNARLDKIPARFDRYSGYENLFKVFQVSVEDLPSEVQAYFKTLIVFSEDAEIPESVLQLYWEHIGQGEYEPLEAVDLLVQRSLLTPGANHNAFVLHDLLRDYLVIEADGEVAELHRQLLMAYKAVYPDGWHTIPYATPYYFYRYWSNHVEAAGERALASSIADALIQHQPLLNLDSVLEALIFVNYEFEDIAHSLLKRNQNSRVLYRSLQILGSKAKEDARRLLKENSDSSVISECLRILDGEAKKNARQLLKESSNPEIIDECFKILGDEAKEDAKRLLKESSDSWMILICLGLLKDEATEEARQLLKSSEDEYIVVACIETLGKEAKAEANRLIKISKSKFIQGCCRKLISSWNDLPKSNTL